MVIFEVVYVPVRLNVLFWYPIFIKLFKVYSYCFNHRHRKWIYEIEIVVCPRPTIKVEVNAVLFSEINLFLLTLFLYGIKDKGQKVCYESSKETRCTAHPLLPSVMCASNLTQSISNRNSRRKWYKSRHRHLVLRFNSVRLGTWWAISINTEEETLTPLVFV